MGYSIAIDLMFGVENLKENKGGGEVGSEKEGVRVNTKEKNNGY